MAVAAEKNAMIARRFVFGVQHDVKDGCQFIDENTVVWTAGKVIVVYNTQYATQKFISCSDTCEAITAMAVSSNRRSLAVAEMSEPPAIAIFDPQTRRRKRWLQVPISKSKEYVCLSFSQDGRYLAALGGYPDWVLVLWSVDRMKPVASVSVTDDSVNPSQDRRLINQCSISPRDSTVMCISGNGIFKFYKHQDSMLKQITSNAAKTEPMNYLAHVWLPPDDRMIVSTDNGDLLLVENFEFRNQLPLSPSDGISIDTLIAHGTKGFICGGDMGTISIFEKSEDKELFRRVKTHNVGAERKDADTLVSTDESVRIVGFSLTPPPSDEVISIMTSNRQLYVLNLSQADYSKAEDRICDVVSQPFHAAPITGLDICIRKPLLVTCGKDRTVMLWNYVTNTVEVVKHFATEVLSVAIHPSGLHLLVGFPDKLRFMNIYGDDIREFRSFSIRSCSECRFSNGGQFFAAMHQTIIHVYYTYTCELLGHLRGHGSKIRSIYFAPPDDTRLLSAGIDGAVYEFSLAEFHKVSDHQLKSISYNAVTASDTTVYVSGNDRKIRQLERLHLNVQDEHDLRNCNAGCLAQALGLNLLFGGCEDGTLRVFNTFLAEKNVLEKAQHDKNNDGTHGSSQAQKSDIMIESHSSNSGPVTRVAVTFDESVVASVGEDGVLTLWDVVAPHRGQHKEVQFAEEILIDKKDLEERNRAIQDLHDKVNELKQRKEHQAHKRELKNNESLAQLKERFHEGRQKQSQLLEKLLGEKNEQAIRFTDNLGDMEEKHRQDLLKIEQEYNAKISTLQDQLKKLDEFTTKQLHDHEAMKKLADEEAKQAAIEAEASYTRQLKEADRAIQDLDRKKREAESEAAAVTREIEGETDIEIMELKEKFEQKMKQEQAQSASLKTENAMMMGKEQIVKNDLGALKTQIDQKTANQATLMNSIHTLERDIEGLKHELSERTDTIGDKDKRIYDLRKKNEELGKFRFVLEYKISELNEQIAPRNEEIELANAKYAEMEFEAAKYLRQNEELVLFIRGLKLKLDGQKREMEKLKEQLTGAHEYQSRLWTELAELHDETNPRQMKELTKALYYRHAVPQSSGEAAKHKPTPPTAGSSKAKPTDDAQREYDRSRDYMERTVAGLKTKLVKDAETNRADKSRITGESVTLIKEINELRREKRTLLMQRRGVTAQSAVHEQQRELEMQRAELQRLRSRVVDLERQLHAAGKIATTAGVATLQ